MGDTTKTVLRPMEWEYKDDFGRAVAAKTEFGEYSICAEKPDFGPFNVFFDHHKNTDFDIELGEFKTRREARAAAEADRIERIKSEERDDKA